MNLALAEQNTSLQVGEGLNSLENGSTPADKPYSIRIIPAIPEPPSKEARNRRWSTPAAFLSLLATILSISRIFGCLLELGYSPAVGMGIHGRMLSLADSSAFRRCMEGGSSRAATPISPLPPVSPVPGVSSFRLLPRGQTNHSDLDNEDILAKQTVKAEEQHVTMKQSVAQGVQQVKQTVERGGQHATSKKAVKGGDERPARNEKPDLFYLIDPLAPIAEEAELRRLKEALLLPASDAVNLTKEDMKVLKKASEKLTWMMKKRSQLAVALRKKLEERERLTAHMVRMSLNREPLRRGFGCLKREPSLFV
ncbi:uncharacterized protein EMH_0073100 [Eimeria mitis]|uniref:Uncharacterized protein n=1 Tax=Eimeria mitis TaxID=44415 RepID=U6KHJ7_9EIME|nr:uncharacterized protein EMH_0073100 [Eimeria mitis]CDJ36266.1 hypothetical protein EMH_0073100 [Eimeria mitis]